MREGKARGYRVRVRTGATAAAIGAAVCAAAPATAADCWRAEAVSAAQMRELQAMMMAVALRCAANDMPIHESYNAFVNANMTTLNAASATLHRQFSGQAGYDRYTTELSNRYGSGHTSATSCAAFAEIGQRAARAAATPAGLAGIAMQMVPQPHLVDNRCTVPTSAAAGGGGQAAPR